MSETLSKESSARSGRIRIDDRPKHLATRLERGEIAVINVADLDRESAAALVAADPVAVLNAQPRWGLASSSRPASSSSTTWARTLCRCAKVKR